MSDDMAVFWAERRRRMAALLVGKATDTTAPTLTSPFALPFGDTSGHIGVVTDEGNGTLYYVLTTSATPPSAAQVKAGQDHAGAAAAASGSQAISSTGTKTATPTGLSSNTLYYPYWMHEDAAGNQSAVKGLTSFTTLTTGTSDTDYDNLIAAMSVAPTDFRKGLIARFIGALYAAGVWSKLAGFYVLRAHDGQAARLDWKNPGTRTLSLVNSPAFAADVGYRSDGSSSYLSLGANIGSLVAQDSVHLGGVYVQAVPNVGSNDAIWGRIDGNGRYRLVQQINGQLIVLISSNSNWFPTGATQSDYQIAVRTGASAQECYSAAASIGTNTTASSGVGTGNTPLMVSSGVYGNAANSLQLAHFGAALTSTEILAMRSAWNNYTAAL